MPYFKLTPAQFNRLSPRQRLAAALSGLSGFSAAVEVKDGPARAGQLIPASRLKSLVVSTLQAPTVGSFVAPGMYRVQLTPSADTINYRDRSLEAGVVPKYTKAIGSNRRPGYPTVVEVCPNPLAGLDETKHSGVGVGRDVAVGGGGTLKPHESARMPLDKAMSAARERAALVASIKENLNELSAIAEADRKAVSALDPRRPSEQAAEAAARTTSEMLDKGRALATSTEKFIERFRVLGGSDKDALDFKRTVDAKLVELKIHAGTSKSVLDKLLQARKLTPGERRPAREQRESGEGRGEGVSSDSGGSSSSSDASSSTGEGPSINPDAVVPAEDAPPPAETVLQAQTASRSNTTTLVLLGLAGLGALYYLTRKK
jgi:hypothetical protein